MSNTDSYLFVCLCR